MPDEDALRAESEKYAALSRMRSPNEDGFVSKIEDELALPCAERHAKLRHDSLANHWVI